MLFPSIQVGGLIFESTQDNIIAAGTTQANAMPIGNIEMNRLTSVAAGSGILLPPARPGAGLIIVNHGANAVQVYGQPGDTIDDVPSAVGTQQMANSWVFYGCFTSPAWYTEGLASGFAPGIAGAFATFATSVITAGTTHTQAGGTPINTMNVAVTVGNAGDGVTLPVAKAGMEITIVNLSGTLAMQVYGNATDSATINGTAGATGVSQALNAVTIYFCFQAGLWVTK